MQYCWKMGGSAWGNGEMVPVICIKFFTNGCSGRCWIIPLGSYHGRMPQSSMLSSMLFNIYLSPFKKIACSSKVGCLQYADDTQLYSTVKKPLTLAVSVLIQCVSVVVKWRRENKLKLNPDKMELMLARRETALNRIVLTDVVQLSLKDSVKILGALLDLDLWLERQLSITAKNTPSPQLYLVRNFVPYYKMHYLAMLTHTLVTSWLDYCNVLPMGQQCGLKPFQSMPLEQRPRRGQGGSDPIGFLIQKG